MISEQTGFNLAPPLLIVDIKIESNHAIKAKVTELMYKIKRIPVGLATTNL